MKPEQPIEESSKEKTPVEKALPELQAINEPKEKPQQPKVEEDSDKDSGGRKVSIKCPQCSHKFSFELGGDTKKIKCPHCGKEGVLE